MSIAAQMPLAWYAGPMPVAFVNHWLKSAMLLGLEDGERTTRGGCEVERGCKGANKSRLGRGRVGVGVRHHAGWRGRTMTRAVMYLSDDDPQFISSFTVTTGLDGRNTLLYGFASCVYSWPFKAPCVKVGCVT